MSGDRGQFPVDAAAVIEALPRMRDAIRAMSVSIEQAAANVRANVQRYPELWARGDEHHVPQIGDDELAAWQDFLSQTKQRSSRIVKR